MCFTVKYITQKKLKYAQRRGDSADEINQLERDIQDLTLNMEAQEAASGFIHPPLLVFKNTKPLKPALLNWGLIPYWINDKKRATQIRNKTLNARGETIFEKPSFKKPAQQQRCLVMVDGFYDYHYIDNKAHPYLFENRDKTPLVFAGLWDNCRTVDDTIWNTVTIVTTPAEGLVKEIQNNPKKTEARTPLILTKETETIWLNNSTKQQIEDVIYAKVVNDLVVQGK